MYNNIGDKMKLTGIDKSKKIVFISGNPIYKIPEDFGYKPKDKLIAKSVDGKIELISEAQFGYETLPSLSKEKEKLENNQIKEKTYNKRKKEILSQYNRKYKVSEDGTIDLTDLLEEESVIIKSKKSINIK